MNDLFPTLEPPPGGLRDLRHRLRREPRRERHLRTSRRVVSVLCVAAFSALGIWSSLVPPSDGSTALVLVDGWVPALLESSPAQNRTASVTTSPAARGRQALLVLQETESDVLIYWIDTLEQSSPNR